MKYYVSNFLFLSVLLLTSIACTSTQSIDKTIRINFLPLVDLSRVKERQFKSILVGVVMPFETKIIPVGTLDEHGTIANEHTMFELGSITKGFLGILLAQDSLRDQINLDEAYEVKTSFALPSLQSEKITWRHLAQHRSGLPRLPENLDTKDFWQPYRDYDFIKLSTFLHGFGLKSVPGESFEYSNLGAGLVSYGLEQIHSRKFHQVLQENLLEPLSMIETVVLLSSDQETRLPPLFCNGKQVQAWQWNDESVLSGAGSVKSTMHDMVILMKVMLGLLHQEFAPAVARATEADFEVAENLHIGLFWNQFKTENIIWHDGGTYGSSSFFGYDPDQRVGIIALSNSNVVYDDEINSRLDLASLKTLLEVIAFLKGY